MDHDTPKNPDVRALQPGLLKADDHKIRRVLEVVDSVSDPAINQALLDTLRPRLAALRPVRPLRLTRLLFIPLDPLTVPLRGWREGDPRVPRPALAPIAKIVRSRLGDLAPVIDGLIAGHKSGATDTITQAGELVWPRAAEILATAQPPSDWAETGLAPTAFRQLAASIAAVLRRAAQLRSLALDEQHRGLTPDAAAVADILGDLSNEPQAGCGMIARLILLQIPHVLPLLRQTAGAGRTQEECDRLQAAVSGAIEAELTQMERAGGFVDTINRGGLAETGAEVRRVLTLLHELEASRSFAVHRPRLNGVRARLDAACRARFARGVNEGLVTMLATATGPVDGAGQTALETVARELRKLEVTARKIGDPAGYDALLRTASDSVLTAADSGTLTPMRKYRLIEILAGTDAAEALYSKACGGR
jgi:hypothetical protein